MKLTKLSLLVSMPGAIVAQNLAQLLSNTPQLSGLNSLLSRHPDILGSYSNITNVTILAPSNDALLNLTHSGAISELSSNNKSVADLLGYHVLRGEYRTSNISDTPVFIPTYLNDSSLTNVTGSQVVEAVQQNNKTYFLSGLFDNSTVTQPDLNFTGGVVHIVDGMLTTPSNISHSAGAVGLTAVVGALRADNMTNNIDTAPNVTVFAPNNTAFQNVGSVFGNITTDQLNNVLGYHIINGTVVYSTDLKNDTQYTAADGQNLTLRNENGSIFVDSARVIRPNLIVANGVVHIIDEVLNPNNTPAAPNATAPTPVPAFPGASPQPSVPFTSNVTGSATATGTGAGAGAGKLGTPTKTSTAAATPMHTGGIGVAMIFGAGAALLNADFF